MSNGRNTEWTLNKNDNGTYSQEQAQLGVLMDIREELRKLNNHLRCHNFVEIPRILRGIRTKLPTRRRKKPGIRPEEKKQ